MKIRAILMAVLSCAGCGAEAPGPQTEEVGQSASALSSRDFEVEFSDCAEFAGIGFVSAQNARPLVPASYSLAGDAVNAIAVVRVASCRDAVVDGKSVGPTITSQIGITLAGGDPTADINNYTVAYATNQPRLHARLQSAGLKTDKSDDIRLLLSGTSLVAASSEFTVAGTSAVPSTPPTTFVASWWADGRHGTVQSRTAFPAIRFGSSSTTLTPTAGTPLDTLLDGTTLTFPILDSYNTFAAARLEVRVAD